MNHLTITNWEKWQSYRSDRGQPPWIKIHRRLMRNVEWVSMSDSERGQLVAIWLLAADHDGVIPASPELIQRLCYMESLPNINKFIELGFICRDGVNAASTRRQDDVPKAEAEAKAEAKAEAEEGQIYCRVIAHLNAKTGKNFKANSRETKTLIKARIDAGFTEQDFYTVIDNKTSQWLSDSKMINFLRPQTLFGTKFESYLQDKPCKKQILKPVTYSQAKDAEGRAMAKWVKGEDDAKYNSEGTCQIPAKLP